LQAVKCQTASSEKKALANPRAMYAMLSNILIDAILSNMLLKYMIEGYNIVGANTLQMTSIGYHN
jgi:hypothetical protein